MIIGHDMTHFIIIFFWWNVEIN